MLYAFLSSSFGSNDCIFRRFLTFSLLLLKYNQVGFKQGIEMLKIFKDHDARSSILDDFYFYDDREKILRERKARQQACSTSDAADSFTDSFVHEMSSNFSQALNLKESSNQAVASEFGASSRKDDSESFGHDSLNHLSGGLSQCMGMDESDKVIASNTGDGEFHDEAADKETTVKSASSCV